MSADPLEFDRLCKEHGRLVLKKFEEGLSVEETAALDKIRQRLDEIEMEKMGPILAELEGHAADLEAVAKDVAELRELLKNRGDK